MGSGNRTSDALRTPAVDIIDKELDDEHAKNAASKAADTSEEGVDGWKVKNFKVCKARAQSQDRSSGSGVE